MAFEWTHLACPKSVYERMVESMRVKIPFPESRAEIKKRVVERYGKTGLTGWFHRGDRIDSLITAFGEPKKKEAGLLTWTMREGDYFYSLGAVIENGKFSRYEADGLVRAPQAIKETVSWVEEQLESSQDDISTEELVAIMMKNKPDHDTKESRYKSWLDCAVKLIEKRKAEPAPFVRIVMQKMSCKWYELELLKKASADQRKEWYQTAAHRLWEKGEDGKMVFRKMDFDELKSAVWVLGEFHEIDLKESNEILERLSVEDRKEAQLLSLMLLEKWDQARHQHEILKALKTLNTNFDQETMHWLFSHLYNDVDSSAVKQKALIIAELNQLKPRLKERYLQWAEAIIKKFKSE